MRARQWMAVGWAAVATMALAGGAWAQGEAQGQPGGEARGGSMPPADQPIIQRIPTPRLVLEGGAGVLGYTGGAASVGPSWNARVTGTVSESFAIEGNYVGAANRAPRVEETLVMTAIDAGVRYNILAPDEGPVVPFVVAGIGYAGWSGENGDPFALTIPLTAGAERMLTRNIKVGARVGFKPAFFDHLGTGDEAPGGDTWSLTGHLGGGF